MIFFWCHLLLPISTFLLKINNIMFHVEHLIENTFNKAKLINKKH